MFGSDHGHGSTKIYPQKISFPSISTEFQDRIEFIGSSNIMDNLILGIGGKKYLIGNLAQKEKGSVNFDRDDRFAHLLYILPGIALATGGDYSGKVAIGLPISDMKRKKELLINLKGKYPITLCGRAHLIELTDILVIPQGAAAFYDLLITDGGEINGSMAQKKVGIIDIGEKTVDFTVFNSCQAVMRLTGSLDLGMMTADLRLLPTIQTELGINCMPSEIKDYRYKVPIDTDRQFKRLADEIFAGISPYWNYRELDEIYLCGGGGIALYDHFKNHIKGVRCNLIPNAQFANARGYYKCLLRSSQSL